MSTSGNTRMSQFLHSDDKQTNHTTKQKDARISVLYFSYQVHSHDPCP